MNDLVIENGKNKNEAIFRNKFVWTQGKLDDEIRNNTQISLSKNLVLSYKKASYDEEVPPNFINNEVGVDTTEQAGKKLIELFE
ncbi:hypothetical protein QM480_24910 [Flectobacillus sp. DC10W]|uniref:Uncharacterized protein n=1 Tax=Flectobacillus longus TaxID=2984207 RepID=A0ABT6YVH4_9BACT|nr:hypothetical protein [Flectobacillus longus]MDI9867604.1 hypothetical protein [Flectobacillus longus]